MTDKIDVGDCVKEVPLEMAGCIVKSMPGGMEPVAYFFRMSLSILRAFLIPVNSLIKELDHDKTR